ncbi:MAG: hypothetical protein ACTSUF_09870 [Candidatus Heimdallarchaeaceae archaeon]
MSGYSKRELLRYYGSTYLIIAVLETVLFTIMGGNYTLRDIVINFSIWGVVWLVTCFTYPLFLKDADPSMLKLPKEFALLGYVIIVVAYYIAYKKHKGFLERRERKKLSFTQILDLYFPANNS